MEALDRLRGANGEGMIGRARSSPWLMVAIAAGAILLLAWIGWAIYVTSSDGASAGLGVVIAWPAMLAALALISLPFIGGYLLIRRLSADSGATATAEAEASGDEDDEETDDGEEEPEDSSEEEGEEDGEEGDEEEDEEGEEDLDEDDEEDEDDSESDSDPEAQKAS